MVNRPVILDIEASGFGAGSFPIEVGIALADGTEHSWLIRPMDHWLHWKDEAEALHGISREYLLNEGLPPEQVADELNELLSGDTTYSDAWGHDSVWLARLFYETGRRQGFRLDSIVSLLKEKELANWAGCRALVVASMGRVEHRACHDAKAIQQTAVLVMSGAQSVATSSGTSAGDDASKVRHESRHQNSSVKVYLGSEGGQGRSGPASEPYWQERY